MVITRSTQTDMNKPILEIIKEAFARGDTVVASQIVIGTEYSRSRAAVALNQLASKGIIEKMSDPFHSGKRGAPAAEWRCIDKEKLSKYKCGNNQHENSSKTKPSGVRVYRCL